MLTNNSLFSQQTDKSFQYYNFRQRIYSNLIGTTCIQTKNSKLMHLPMNGFSGVLSTRPVLFSGSVNYCWDMFNRIGEIGSRMNVHIFIVFLSHFIFSDSVFILWISFFYSFLLQQLLSLSQQ